MELPPRPSSSRGARRGFGLSALALAGLTLASCAHGPGLEPSSETPYVRGPVESFTHHATASSLLVRAGSGSREPCGIAATVDAQTRYFQREPSGTLRQTERAAVAVGDTVEVYVDGAVMESCPVQARASAVVRVSGSAPRTR